MKYRALSRFPWVLLSAVIIPGLIEATAYAADGPLPQPFPEAQHSGVGTALGMILVLSLVLESAMTPIFNWRVFLSRFEAKGLKTPLTVAVAFAVFWKYDIDIIHDLLVALNRSPANTPMTLTGKLLSSLLIAGGSQGIFDLLRRLNFRDQVAREQRLRDVIATRTARSNTPAVSLVNNRDPGTEREPALST
jgi:hypothetical protein